MLEILKIKPTKTYKLRLAVLKTCDDYQYKYQGDFNKSTIHFGAYDNKLNVGVVSLMENNHTYFIGKQMQLRGMAVLNNQQNKGIGKALIRNFIKESRKRNADLIWCNARDYSVEFYRKQGFHIKGEKFFIKNVCDHYVMFLKL